MKSISFASFMFFAAFDVLASLAERGVKLPAVLPAAQSSNVLVKVTPVDDVISSVATSPNLMLLQSSPVHRIDGNELVDFGSLNLRDILSELPSVVSEGSMAASASDSTGLNYVDLRHLGAKRTLVLVNGKRQVSGSPDAMQLDLSTIPVALIDYIDVVTGGAAATYGADAISGVINIHMKDNFQGQELELFGASSLHGDFAGQRGGSYLFGRDFAQSRGNVNVYLSYEQTDNVMAADLIQYQQWGRAFNLDGQLGPQNAQFVWMPHMVNPSISRTGVINNQTFDLSGEAISICQSEIQGFSKGYFPNGCEYAFYDEAYTTVTPATDSWLVSTTVNYDLTDDLQWASELKLSRSNNTQYNIANLFQSNSFGGASDQVVDDYSDEIQTFSISYLAKLFDEFGEHYLTNDRELLHVSSSILGSIDLPDTVADFEVYFLYGKNKSAQTTYNKAHLGLLSLAAQMMLAGGDKFNCERVIEQYEDEIPCIPYPFNGFDLAAEEVKAQLKGDLFDKKKTRLIALGSTLNADTNGWLETAAGPIEFQLGFEWRKEVYDIEVYDPTKEINITSIPAPLDQDGQIITFESFIDLAMPLYVSENADKKLNFNTSIRRVDYSHIGSHIGWQLGLNYQANDNWYWRGTIEKSVRGPNLVEAFNDGVDSSVFLRNPCTSGRLLQGEEGDLVCIPHNGLNIAAVWVDAKINGGGDTHAEHSTAKTLGVAWSHDDADILAISLDYFEYSIDNAILDIDAKDVFKNCIQFQQLDDNQYCDRVEMDNDYGMPSLITAGFINAASMDLAGIDSKIEHKSSFNWFGIPVQQQWRMSASYLLQLDQYEFLRAPDLVNHQRGEVGDPKWQIGIDASFSFGSWTLDWASRYIHRTSNIEVTPDRTTGFEAYPYYVGSIITSDLVFGYVSDSGYQFNLGVRNIFDKVPPGYIDDFSYDLVGRRAFLQVNIGL